MPTTKLRVMIDRHEHHPYARRPSVAPIFKFILIFTVAMILVIAAVAGTVLAVEGPISDSIQSNQGGGK